MRTVVAHSQADADSLAVRLADRGVENRTPARIEVLPEHRRPSWPRRRRAGRTPCIRVRFPGRERRLRGRRGGGRHWSSSAPKARPSGCWATRSPPARRPSRPGFRPWREAPAVSAPPKPRTPLVARIGFPVLVKAAAGGRRARHPCRERSGGVRTAHAPGGRGSPCGVRGRWHLRREVHPQGPPRRGPDPGRRRENVVHCFERECSLQRPPPENMGGSAGPWPCPNLSAGRSAPLALSLAHLGPLSRGGHAGVPVRRRLRSVLFPGDEHPHPGRASGDRVRHRHRSGCGRC